MICTESFRNEPSSLLSQANSPSKQHLSLFSMVSLSLYAPYIRTCTCFRKPSCEQPWYIMARGVKLCRWNLALMTRDVIFRIRVPDPIRLSKNLSSISAQVVNKLTLLNFLSMRMISVDVLLNHGIGVVSWPMAQNLKLLWVVKTSSDLEKLSLFLSHRRSLFLQKTTEREWGEDNIKNRSDKFHHKGEWIWGDLGIHSGKWV